jgi:hypothetical protein
MVQNFKMAGIIQASALYRQCGLRLGSSGWMVSAIRHDSFRHGSEFHTCQGYRLSLPRPVGYPNLNHPQFC